ncbi:MAG: hypothetical protein U0169_06570 [Polyangiaceae bacterium]
MNRTTRALLALAVAIPVTAWGFAGCGEEPGADANLGQTVASDLPIRRFFLVRGTGADVRDVLAELASKPDNQSVVLQYVQANSATRHLGAVVSGSFREFASDGTHHLNGVVAATSKHVLVCASEVSARYVGPGPAGTVFAYTESGKNRSVCWASADAKTWKRTVVDEVNAKEGVLWSEFLRVNDAGDAFEFLALKDSEFDIDDRTSVGRNPADKSITRTLRVKDDLSLDVGQPASEPYPDFTLAMTKAATSLSCEGRCGKLWDGTEFLPCGGCAGGQSCSLGRCTTATCTPLPKEVACAARAADVACGEHSDGCGGTVDCGGCGKGEVCGAASAPGYCGVRVGKMTAEVLRARYRDSQGRLCGTFKDAKLGETLDLGPCKTAGQNCVHNLCTK